MSVAELIGIISGIIAIVDASRKVCEAVEDASGLPRSFRNAVSRLPVVQNTLETARKALEEEEGEEEAEEENEQEISRVNSHDALAKILKSCYHKATDLNKTLQAVMPTQGASKTTRYIKAIKLFPNSDKVEGLMNDILNDVHVLAANYSVKSATRRQIKDLIGIVKKVEKREYMYSGRRATIALCNTGKGSQFIYDGQGNQNVSMGKGMQLNGSSTAPIYISLTK